jgi:hypothetical protein
VRRTETRSELKPPARGERTGDTAPNDWRGFWFENRRPANHHAGRRATPELLEWISMDPC